MVKMEQARLTSVLVIIFCLHQGYAFPEGPPAWTCADGYPHHGADAQTSSPPFTITATPSTYTPGQTTTIQLTLQGSNGQSFEGFLIRVQRTTDGTDKEQCLGEFRTPFPNGVRKHNYHAFTPGLINCLSHGQEIDTSSLTFQWLPPSTCAGPLVVTATVLEDYDKFWTNVQTTISTNCAINEQTTDTTPGDAVTVDLSTCGSQKGCALYPDGCDGTSCRYAVTWQQDPSNPNYVLFEASVETDDEYLALGYSRNDDMDETDTNHCIATEDATPISSIQHGYNGEVEGEDFNERHRIKDFKGLNVKRLDGRLICTFSRPLTLNYYTYDSSDNVVNLSFDMATESFTLFVATGPVWLNSDAAQKHKQLPVISKKKINFWTDKSIFDMTAVPLHLKIHGSLGMLAWTTMAAFGMVLARHYRSALGGKCLGTGAWFQLHRGFMIGTALVCATTIGVIFGFLKEWTQSATIHAICGLVAMLLAIFQICIGMCRPHLDAPRRPLFNWVHRICGVTGFLVAAAAVVLGLTNVLIDLTLAKYEAIIIGVWLGFYLIMEIILEIIKHCASEVQDPGKPQDDKMYIAYQDPDKPTDKSSKNTVLLIALAFIVICMLVFLSVAIAFLAMA